MNLNDIHHGIVKRKKRKRIGRGIGSGHGKTAGRGHKGFGSRAGSSTSPIFEGVHNKWADTVAVVNVGQLDTVFDAGEEVTLAALKVKNIAKGQFDVLKVLGNGDLTKGLTIHAHRFSRSALEKIEKAGGKAVVLPGKAPVVKGKKKSK